MAQYSLGIDVGGTTVKLGIVTASGKIIQQKEMLTDAAGGPAQFTERLVKTTKELMEESKIKKSQFKGVGIGCPSWDGDKQQIGEAYNLPGFNGLALGKIMEKELRLPASVDNDANAAVRGERMFGGWGEASANIVLYTLGTGVGGGVIHTNPRTGVTTKITGQKMRGAELGHVTIALPSGVQSRSCTCCHRDCLEAHVSATAVQEIAREKVKKLIEKGKKTRIIDLVRENSCLEKGKLDSQGKRSKVEHIEAKHVALAAGEGDELALEIEDQTASALAEGIRNAAHTFDPEIVVFAGKMGIGWRSMVEKAKAKYRGTKGVVLGKDLRIETSRLENPGILGAAALVGSPG